MFVEDFVRAIAKLLELEEMSTFVRLIFAASDDTNEVFGEDERHTFTIDAKLLLEMTKEMAKVNVENVALFIHHNVVGISIANAKNERGHAISRTAVRERFDGLQISSFIFVFLFNPPM